MNRFSCCLLISAILVSIGSLQAGDDPAFHRTGIPAVDFFGTSAGMTVPAAHQDFPMQDNVITSEVPGEKSPWTAGLLSLAVPGAGEVYANSPVKGAVFFAAEAASWIMYAVYEKKGNDQKNLYTAYANEHYSPVRYAKWLKDYIVGRSIPGITPADTTYLFNGTPDLTGGPPFSSLNWARLNNIESELGSEAVGFTHQLPYYGEQQYFELIGKYIQFIKGWDTEDITDLNLPEVQDRYLPEHRQFFSYGEMFNQADSYYNTASSFVSVIVVNHLLSAIDAFWTASRYNSSLHADVRMNLQPTPLGLVPVTEAKLTYEF